MVITIVIAIIFNNNLSRQVEAVFDRFPEQLAPLAADACARLCATFLRRCGPYSILAVFLFIYYYYYYYYYFYRYFYYDFYYY